MFDAARLEIVQPRLWLKCFEKSNIATTGARVPAAQGVTRPPLGMVLGVATEDLRLYTLLLFGSLSSIG